MGCDVRSYDFTSDWSIGRFTQTDPILGNRPTEHYAYAFNNPVGFKDPLGLYGWGVTAPSGQNMTGIDEAARRELGKRTARVATGVGKGAEGLKDMVVGLGYGTKQIVTNPGEYWDDLTTVVQNAPDAIVEGVAQKYLEIERDPGVIDEIAGQVSFDAITGALGAKGIDKLAKLKFAPKATPRPTWQSTELTAQAELAEFGFKSQVSFKNGQVVSGGTEGSVRPDLYSKYFEMAVDDKNYNLADPQGRARLMQKLLEQTEARKQNLPPGTRQGLILDTRGQTVEQKWMDRLINRIERRTGIEKDNIWILGDEKK